jgi:hypothetical protein
MNDGATPTIIVAPGPDVRAAVSANEATVTVQFDVRKGHVDPNARVRLVAEVFALPVVLGSRHLRAALPLGEAELLAALRFRCPSMTWRAAGATCLVDADLE